jgi:excisionase family DNA binding protein
MEKKLTVSQMAEYLGVSKEAIYNRLRRGSLQSIIEDGKKYVLLTDSVKKEGSLPKRNQTKSHESEYIELLKSQIVELKEKNQKLEFDKEKLLQQIQNMLLESKEQIEKIYKERDEQLKTILTLANIPTLGHKLQETTNDEPIDVLEEVEIEEDIVEKICKDYEEWQLVKNYLKKRDFSSKTKKKIEKKLLKQIDKSPHVKIVDDELFIKKGVKLKKIIG